MRNGENRMENYKILYQGGSGEVLEKKSRFIATTRPVETEGEAVAFIESMKKTYWDASHNCSAYIIGAEGHLKRCSDDGEPSQTAGRPMLDVLEGAGVCNICLVVTRYFGGTLLGTGGLVRAYSEAAKEGLAQSVILEKHLGRRVLIHTDYSGIGKIQYLAAQPGVTILDTVYTDQVLVTLLVPHNDLGSLCAKVTEKTSGKAVIEEQEALYYAKLEEEILLFNH